MLIFFLNFLYMVGPLVTWQRNSPAPPEGLFLPLSLIRKPLFLLHLDQQSYLSLRRSARTQSGPEKWWTLSLHTSGVDPNKVRFTAEEDSSRATRLDIDAPQLAHKKRRHMTGKFGRMTMTNIDSFMWSGKGGKTGGRNHSAQTRSRNSWERVLQHM